MQLKTSLVQDVGMWPVMLNGFAGNDSVARLLPDDDQVSKCQEEKAFIFVFVEAARNCRSTNKLLCQHV